jgi:hypothetical protein
MLRYNYVGFRCVREVVASPCAGPAITTQPAGQTIAAGSTADLTVTASGSAPLSYQWYEGAAGTTAKPVGTNSATFRTPALTTAATYWVRVINACGQVDSAAATVAVTGRQGTSVVGRVVWDASPVANAGIEIKNPGNYYTTLVLVRTTTGPDGRFSITDPPTGDLYIYAVAPSSEYMDWAGRPVTISIGAQTDVGDLALSKKMQLLSPASGAIVSTTTPVLRWSAFPGATKYTVSVFNNRTSERKFLQTTANTEATVDPPLQRGEEYQWGVYAENARGQIAYWSAWYFKVQ